MTLAPNTTSGPLRGRVAVAVALLMLAVGGIATLQLPAGPMPGDGLGPGMDAMHDGDIGPMLPRVLERAKASLNLDARQQRLWDNAAAQSKAAREAARPGRRQVKDTLIAELAKAEPDLKGFAGAADPVNLESQAERRKLRDLWLDLYAELLPEQKAVIRDLLRDRLARADAFHDRMRAQVQQRRGASGG